MNFWTLLEHENDCTTWYDLIHWPVRNITVVFNKSRGHAICILKQTYLPAGASQTQRTVLTLTDHCQKMRKRSGIESNFIFFDLQFTDNIIHPQSMRKVWSSQEHFILCSSLSLTAESQDAFRHLLSVALNVIF